MKKTFKGWLKEEAGCCAWWFFGFICLVCLFLILGGLLMFFVDRENATASIVLITIGVLTLLFFGWVFIVLPYTQWKKGIEPKPVTLPESHKIGQISKESILSDIYIRNQKIRLFSLPITIAIAVIVFFMFNRQTDLSNLFTLILLIVMESLILFFGILFFVSSNDTIKKFGNIKLEFYKRPVAGKTRRLGIDGEQDKYHFEFDGFVGSYEMVSGINLSDKIEVGDDCVLVCYQDNKSIVKMYCMKHWDFSDDIMSELK